MYTDRLIIFGEKMDCKPKLRFPEFSGEWEETQLNKLLSFKNGLNASKEKYGKGMKFINVSDILNNDFLTYDNIEGSVEVSKEQFDNYLVTYGDVLFQRSSETREEVGTSNVYLDPEIDCVFGGFVIRGKKIAEYNPFFLKELLTTSSVRKEITSRSGGSTRYNIGQESLKIVEIKIPSIPEQEKISSFLSKVDSKIDLLEKKQEFWETYKKGIMQQIFSQKLRFKDENGEEYPDWEEKKLGDVGKFVSGCGFSEKYQGLDNLPIKFFKVSDMNNIGNEKYMFYSNNTVSESIMQMLKSKPIKQLGIIFAKVGAAIFLERKRIARPPFMVDNNMMVLLCNKETNLEFIYYFLKNIRISKYAQVGALPSITGRDLQTVKINVPVFDEQIKIANFFSAIDSKVNILNKELKIIKNFKKGLLQQMFC